VADLRKAVLSRSSVFVTVTAERLMTYALGRAVVHTDMPAVRAIARDAARNGNKFSTLVAGIVKSPAFQYKVKKAQTGAGN
jgi:hypothetical protein